MAEQERIDAPDTDQFPVQTAPGAPGGQTVAERTPTATDEPAAPTAPAAPAVPAPRVGAQSYHRVRRTWVSGLWVGVTVAAAVLVVLLVFIIENSQTVNISFFGAHGHLSLGVALLLAAVCGVLLVAVPGYGRIIQLRRALKRTAAHVDGPTTT